MKIISKFAEWVGYVFLCGERFDEWRCPNKDCGLHVSEDYICCPHCGQKIKFKKSQARKVEMKIEHIVNACDEMGKPVFLKSSLTGIWGKPFPRELPEKTNENVKKEENNMNQTNLNCTLNDTTELRNLILENPELPLLIFCGEEAWSGDWGYTQADADSGSIQDLTLYNSEWVDRDGYKDRLSDNLCDEEEYEDLSPEEYGEMIEQKVAETEFVKAIVIYVG